MTAANGNRAASSTWLTGMTFTALATPLAMFGAQPLDLSLGNLTIRGSLDDYAMEYFGAAAFVSLGLGASRLRKSSGDVQKAASKSRLTPSSTLYSASAESQASLSSSDSSLLTEASLKASGLHLFLAEDDAPMVVHSAPLDESLRAPDADGVAVGFAQAPAHSGLFEFQLPDAARQASSAPQLEHHPSNRSLASEDALASIVAEVQSLVQQICSQSQEVAAVQQFSPSVVQESAPPVSKPAVRVAALPLNSHHTAPIFPAAQSYVSFARSKGVAEQSLTRDLTAELAVLDQIYQVREQMQHLMNQVDLIQADLEQTVYPAQRLVPLRAAKAPSYTVSSIEPLRAATAQAADVWSGYRATA